MWVYHCRDFVDKVVCLTFVEVGGPPADKLAHEEVVVHGDLVLKAGLLDVLVHPAVDVVVLLGEALRLHHPTEITDGVHLRARKGLEPIMEAHSKCNLYFKK